MDRLQQQHRDRRHLDKGQEVACRLFVARRNPAVLFGSVDESLHEISLLVQVTIKLALIFQITPRGNHRFRSTVLNVADQLLTVESFLALAAVM